MRDWLITALLGLLGGSASPRVAQSRVEPVIPVEKKPPFRIPLSALRAARVTQHLHQPPKEPLNNVDTATRRSIGEQPQQQSWLRCGNSPWRAPASTNTASKLAARSSWQRWTRSGLLRRCSDRGGTDRLGYGCRAFTA